jgi:hypothetical protein
MAEAPMIHAVGTARRERVAEVVGRAGLLVIAAVWLPHVFPADVSHFRDIASCIARPNAHLLAMCNRKHFPIAPLGHGFNLPYRHVLFEFPPLPLLALPLVGRWVGSLVTARLLFGTVMAGFEFGALVALRRAWPELRGELTFWWNAAVLPVAVLAWFRFDFLAVFFATVGLVAIEKQRRATVPIVLGWLSKLWPAVLVVALVVRRRWSEVAASVVAIGVVTALWYAVSPKGFSTFLQYRAGKGLEVESVLASVQFLTVHGHAKGASGAWVINNGAYAWANPVLTGLLLAFALASVLRAWKPGADVVALCGALTLASMLFSRILSAQYVVWVAPFVALVAARGNRRAGWLYVAAGWLTLTYLLWFDSSVIPGNRLLGGVTLARNLCLVALLVELFLAIRPRDPVTAPVAELA